MPDQSKWSTIFCITTQLSTARSIYLETWIYLYILKRAFNAQWLTKTWPYFCHLLNSCAVPVKVKMVQSWAWAHHYITPYFLQSLVRPPFAPQLQQWDLLSHFYIHWISVWDGGWGLGVSAPNLIFWNVLFPNIYKTLSSQIFRKCSLSKYLENALFSNI